MHQNDALISLIVLRISYSIATKEVSITAQNANIKLTYILAQLNYQVDRDKTYLPFVNKNIAPNNLKANSKMSN